MLRISAGSCPRLPNQSGTRVSNSATSPGPMTQSLFPSRAAVAGQNVNPLITVVGWAGIAVERLSSALPGAAAEPLGQGTDRAAAHAGFQRNKAPRARPMD